MHRLSGGFAERQDRLAHGGPVQLRRQDPQCRGGRGLGGADIQPGGRSTAVSAFRPGQHGHSRGPGFGRVRRFPEVLSRRPSRRGGDAQPRHGGKHPGHRRHGLLLLLSRAKSGRRADQARPGRAGFVHLHSHAKLRSQRRPLQRQRLYRRRRNQLRGRFRRGRRRPGQTGASGVQHRADPVRPGQHG